MVGIFIYNTDGGDIHIHCRGWGHSHTLQRVGSFTYIAEGGVIHICDRLWENRPLRAQYDFSVEAFVVYLT